MPSSLFASYHRQLMVVAILLITTVAACGVADNSTSIEGSSSNGETSNDGASGNGETATPGSIIAQQQSGEVIEIYGCTSSEVLVDDVCMPRGFMNWLCDWLITCNPSPGNPPEDGEDPPGGGPNPNPPSKPTPTLEQCQESFNQCQDHVATVGVQRCIADRGRIAGRLVNQGLTCIGDASDVWDELDDLRDAGIPYYTCSEEDWTRFPSGPGSAAPRECRRRFVEAAMKTCIQGRNDITRSSGSSFSVQMPIPGFGPFGVESSVSSTVQVKGGAGIREQCVAAAMKASNEGCTEARNQCEAIANGTANLVIPENKPSIQELLAMIDHQRLGLESTGPSVPLPADSLAPGSFRDTQQGSSEMDEVYHLRLQFLADWSQFLNESDVTPDQQKEIQLAFQNAQGIFTAITNEFDILMIYSFLIDPETGRVGTPEYQRLLQSFVENGEFRRRATDAEAALFRDVGAILGQAGLEQFKTQVWPGIYQFGFSGPMHLLPVSTLEP